VPVSRQCTVRTCNAGGTEGVSIHAALYTRRTEGPQGPGDNFPLIEALPPRYGKRARLPGAINIPVDEQFEEKAREAVPDKGRTIITYGTGNECPASRNTAERLDGLGYENVLAYEGGKADWGIGCRAARCSPSGSVTRLLPPRTAYWPIPSR